MTTLDLDAIQARADAATEGPWDVSDCEGELSVDAGTARTMWTTTEDGFRFGRSPSSWKLTDRILEHELETWDEGEDADDDQRRADAEFIAHAREDIPALISLVRELQASIPARVVLDGDPEVIEAALDALPVGSIVESSAEAVAGQEPRAWARESNGMSRDHIGWRGTGRMTMFGSDYLAKYCAPLVVIR